jgi:hypothetical protein
MFICSVILFETRQNDAVCVSKLFRQRIVQVNQCAQRPQCNGFPPRQGFLTKWKAHRLWLSHWISWNIGETFEKPVLAPNFSLCYTNSRNPMWQPYRSVIPFNQDKVCLLKRKHTVYGCLIGFLKHVIKLLKNRFWKKNTILKFPDRF